MDNVRLVVQARDDVGTRASRRLRRSGLIPGVLYGHGKAATPIAVEPTQLRAALSTDAGRHAVLDVTLEGHKRSHKAIVKEMALDRVKNTVTHVDLQEIRLDDIIEARVEVRFEGVAAGVKMGGMLDESTREITVKAKVTEVPEHFTLDISELEMGDTRHVSDLQVPHGVEVLDDPELVLCSVLAPRKIEEPVEAEGEEEGVEVEEEAESAEPEVIGKQKDEDETAD